MANIKKKILTTLLEKLRSCVTSSKQTLKKMLMRLAMEGIRKVAVWVCNVRSNVVSSSDQKKSLGRRYRTVHV